MTAVGRQALAKAFNLCDESSLEHPENVKSWLGDGVIFPPAQSNDPSCDGALCSIGKVRKETGCEIELHGKCCSYTVAGSSLLF